ncbi:MAG: SLBB domain-containing protein [Idiomarina sp.]|nr:SLBB domain-containing protein [Idiomarina sp.]
MIGKVLLTGHAKLKCLSAFGFISIVVVAIISAPLTISHAQAQQLSQEQIEQFRRLPRAQQEALARQYGFDLSLLERQATTERGAEGEEELVRRRGAAQQDEERRDGERTDTRHDRDREAERLTEREVKPFGYNLFAGEPSTFAQMNNVPVPGNYRIGAGDSILVQLYGQESISHSLTVDREGRISIPRLGPLTVAGLTYDEMKDLIAHQVRTRMIGMNVAVSMGELRSMQIFVLGEAHQPGAYTVSSLTTISQALFASGGLTDIASLRNVQLRRAGETIVTFDLYDLLLRGDASNDRILQPGDAVFIPSRGDMVKISGEVVRPAIYELKGGERLDEVIALAGGLLPSGFPAALQVHRAKDGQRRLQTVDATAAAGRSLVMQGGDEVRVPRISEVIDNSIAIRGAVTRSGYYEYRTGLRISSFVRSVTQDLLPDADLSYGVILRENPTTRRLSVVQFDVASAIRGDRTHDHTLQERDQILFFSRFQYEKERARAGFGSNAERVLEINPEMLADNSREKLLESVIARLESQGSTDANARTVRITGEVRYPGTYPLATNASVAGLVAAAGGLRESAYLARAEITRTVIDEGMAETDYIPFNLYDVIMGNANVDIIARDRLNIFRIPEWQDTVDVTLEGEVRFPGTYAVRRGETILDVVERAGGLTSYAFTKGAVFTREEIKEQEAERLEALVRTLRQDIAAISLTDSSRVANYEQLNLLLNDLLGAEPVGRMVVDLASILEGNRGRDIELRDGDRLIVPSMRSTISIIGEVNVPTTYRYDDSLSIRDYIERSGGTKQRADTKRMFVVRANGEVESYSQRRGWFSSASRVELRPGDTIVVPLDTTYRDTTQVWATSTQIIYQLAVAAAAISRI